MTCIKFTYQIDARKKIIKMKAYQLVESAKDILEDLEMGEYFVSEEELDQGSDSLSFEVVQRLTRYSAR